MPICRYLGRHHDPHLDPQLQWVGKAEHRRIAVKIVDDRGIESLKIVELPE